MNEFSFVRAWSKGVGFFSGAVLNHAIILLGLGVLVPTIVQLLLVGMPVALMNSTLSAAAPSAAARAITGGAGLVLPLASYFASWRLGLARAETLGGAIVFRLLSGLAVSVGFGLLLVALAAAAAAISAPFAVIAIIVATLAVLAMAWTAFAAIVTVALCTLFVVALGIGAATGNPTLAATMVGGAGWVWTIVIAAALASLWLAARFSCTMVLMAERKSFNAVAAARDSWSLTWDDEWRITRYLGLLGLAITLVLGAAGVAIGAGLAAGLRGGGQPMAGMAFLLSPLLSIPLAYLSVLVPAGIYRELAPADVASAEVFA